MRFSSIERVYDRLVAQGKLTERQAAHASLVTIFEHATLAFLGGQFGEKVVAQAKDDVRGADQVTRRAFERHAPDLGGLTSALARESITTTLDLPAIVGRARDIINRNDGRAAEMLISPLFDGSAKRTATDFRTIYGIKTTEDGKGLFPTPEGASVTYDKIERTTEGYSVMPYSVASGWTWEARVNDDLGSFLEEVRLFGERGTRNRRLVIYDAIDAALSESTPSGSQPSGGTAAAGGPTIANIEWAAATLAADNRVLGAVTVPPKWNPLARMTAASQVVPGSDTPNPAQGTSINLERGLGVGTPLTTAGNWLAHEAVIATWLEFATLTGFEAGARIVFKLPDTDARDLGSFENMTEAFKIVDAIAAKVTDADSVIEVKNA